MNRKPRRIIVDLCPIDTYVHVQCYEGCDRSYHLWTRASKKRFDNVLLKTFELTGINSNRVSTQFFFDRKGE